MTQKRMLLIIWSIFVVLMSGCAGVESSLDPANPEEFQRMLEEAGVEKQKTTELPGQVIVYQENSIPDVELQYGALELRQHQENDNKFSLKYVDLNKDHFVSEETLAVYFKIDISNPQGKKLVFHPQSIVKSTRGRVDYSTKPQSGNLEFFSVYFYAPKLEKDLVSETTVSVVSDGYTAETFTLRCIFGAGEEINSTK